MNMIYIPQKLRSIHQ